MNSAWDMRFNIWYISYVRVLSATENIRVGWTSKLIHQRVPSPTTACCHHMHLLWGLIRLFQINSGWVCPIIHPLSLQPCPSGRRLWSLHPRSCSRLVWMGLWVFCSSGRCSCPWNWVIFKVLSNPNLWFCDVPETHLVSPSVNERLCLLSKKISKYCRRVIAVMLHSCSYYVCLYI